LLRDFSFEDFMVEFNQEVRKMCRNPKCRMKLLTPTSNEREAFCNRGCYQSFYLHRCRVCEGQIEQKRDGRRMLCKKAACRNAFSCNFAGGCYLTPSAPSYPSKTPDFIGPKEALKPDRAWRQIAGPALTASQLHCATIPDGEIVDGKPTWDGGSYERIEAQNHKAHFANLNAAEEVEIEANDYFTEPEWREVISPDGVLCYATRFRPATTVKNVSGSQRHIPDDLSIPPFLDRRPRPEQLWEAA
jgi:hypothetical protein